MKKILIALLFLGITGASFAQKNIIKGSALFTPLPILYTLGVGYERVVGDMFSIQVSYSYDGYSFENSHGDGASHQRIEPAIRYYFGPQQSFRKQIFVSIFTEFVQFMEYSNDDYSARDSYWDKSEGNMVNPGILFGKNIMLGNRMHMELFIGWKYKFISKTETHFDNGIKYSFPVNEQTSGVKLGFNFAYSF